MRRFEQPASRLSSAQTLERLETSHNAELSYAAVFEAIKAGIYSVKGSAVADHEISDLTGLWADGDPDRPCLDFDSLDLLEFVVFLEREFGWAITEEQIDADGWRTVDDLVAFIMNIQAVRAPHD